VKKRRRRGSLGSGNRRDERRRSDFCSEKEKGEEEGWPNECSGTMEEWQLWDTALRFVEPIEEKRKRKKRRKEGKQQRPQERGLFPQPEP
jgi:hypothetical protein